MPEKDENPVSSGLVALVAVAVVVGILGAIGAVMATRVLGLSDASDAAADSAGGAGDTFYMPDPEPTEEPSGPLVTLVPSEEPSASKSTDKEFDDESESADPDDEESESESADGGEITLSQGAFEVSAGQQLYLSGIYPGGEGAVLDIQSRAEGGSWEEFPVDVSVSNETFSTYVETYRTGTLSWRVVDSSTGTKSNEIRVRHTS